MDSSKVNAQNAGDLDHSWDGDHSARNNGLWNNWVPAKTEQTMGYFTRADIPFQYALADAFTICDGYHQAILAPTSPNRMYFWAGTSGGWITNPDDYTVEFSGADAITTYPWLPNAGVPLGPNHVNHVLAQFLTYDEHDGYFDHVLPPAPETSVKNEFIDGLPIGFGSRVPMIVASPWTRGGYVDSGTYNHTSMLQFLETWTRGVDDLDGRHDGQVFSLKLRFTRVRHAPGRCDRDPRSYSPWVAVIFGRRTR